MTDAECEFAAELARLRAELEAMTRAYRDEANANELLHASLRAAHAENARVRSLLGEHLCQTQS